MADTPIVTGKKRKYAILKTLPVKDPEITGSVYHWSLEPSYYTDAVVLRGRILDDVKGRFADHTQIRSSAITYIDWDRNLAYTLNSVYKLLWSYEVPKEKFDG